MIPNLVRSRKLFGSLRYTSPLVSLLAAGLRFAQPAPLLGITYAKENTFVLENTLFYFKMIPTLKNHHRGGGGFDPFLAGAKGGLGPKWRMLRNQLFKGSRLRYDSIFQQNLCFPHACIALAIAWKQESEVEILIVRNFFSRQPIKLKFCSFHNFRSPIEWYQTWSDRGNFLGHWDTPAL